MGNGSSNDITFYNCSNTSYTIDSKSNGSDSLPSPAGGVCTNLNFPFEANDFTLTTGNGQSYTLLGSGISNLGYNTVYIWDSIQTNSDVSSDKFYYFNGESIKASRVEKSLNLSMTQSIAVLMSDDLSSIDFSSVCKINQSPVDSGTTGDDDKPSKPKVPSTIWIIVVLLTFLIVTVVVGFVIYKYYKKNKLVHSSSNS
jgi:hypothetical protein